MHIDRRLALIATAAGSIILLAGCGAAITPTSTAPAATAPTAAAVVVAAPTAVPTADPNAGVAAWAAVISPDLSTIGTDMTSVGNDGTDTTAMSADLATLLADVTTTQTDMANNPAPVAERPAAATLTHALTDYSTGCSEAIDALGTGNGGELTAATTIIGNGNTLIGTATSELVVP
jgi:hypothetical protein